MKGDWEKVRDGMGGWGGGGAFAPCWVRQWLQCHNVSVIYAIATIDLFASLSSSLQGS